MSSAAVRGVRAGICGALGSTEAAALLAAVRGVSWERGVGLRWSSPTLGASSRRLGTPTRGSRGVPSGVGAPLSPPLPPPVRSAGPLAGSPTDARVLLRDMRDHVREKALPPPSSCSRCSAATLACSCSFMRPRMAARADLGPTRGVASTSRGVNCTSTLGVGRSLGMLMGESGGITPSTSDAVDSIDERASRCIARIDARFVSSTTAAARAAALVAGFSRGSRGLSCLPCWMLAMRRANASSPLSAPPSPLPSPLAPPPSPPLPSPPPAGLTDVPRSDFPTCSDVTRSTLGGSVKLRPRGLAPSSFVSLLSARAAALAAASPAS
mmetsp:Transcript_54373/g.161552  ORF Transcript_54373/g.161552 Transcript_54373/m.161552 type:complete len:325 (+) Transcript_54373:292-1266(+)